MSKTKLEYVAEVTALKGYSYRLWEYCATLSQLTVRGTRPDKPKHNVHIIFQYVGYIQMPMYWAGDFKLGSADEYREMAKKTGWGDRFEKALLFQADTPNGPVYVLCGGVYLEQDVEPIY